jgi:hypothetical protein
LHLFEYFGAGELSKESHLTRSTEYTTCTKKQNALAWNRNDFYRHKVTNLRRREHRSVAGGGHITKDKVVQETRSRSRRHQTVHRIMITTLKN